MFRRIYDISKAGDARSKKVADISKVAPLLSPNDETLAGVFNNSNVNDWIVMSNGLSQVRDSIKGALNEDMLDDEDKYHSIPNVFARVALNEIVLGDPAHPLHDAFVISWRAAFTMIQLYDELGLDIIVETIDLGSVKDSSPVFSYVASKYIDILNMGDEKKIDMYLCRVESSTDPDARFPLALYSPHTVLCPAKEFSGRVIDAPSFIKHIPVDINGKEVHLGPKVAGEPPMDENGEPVDWIAKLEDPTDYLKANPLLAHKLCRYLKKALEIHPSNGISSKFIEEFITDISPSPSPDEEFKNPLIAGISIIAQLSLDGADVEAEGLTKDAIFNKHICFVTPERDDLNNLYGSYVFDGDHFDEAPMHRIGLLPLKDEFIINHLSPTRLDGRFEETLLQLENNLKMKHDKGDDDRSPSIIVEFIQYKHTFLKRYPYSTWIEPGDRDEHEDPGDTDESRRNSNIPPIAVWPSKVDPLGQWKAYYVFQSTSASNARKGLIFTPVLDPVVDKIGEYHEGNLEEPDENTRFTVKRTKSFPFFLSATLHGEESVGVLIVKPSAKLNSNPRNGHMMIGIDFGTSSTISYMANVVANQPDHDIVPREMSFNDESVLYVSDSVSCESLATHMFFPKKTLRDAKAFFYTLLYEHMPVIPPTPKLLPEKYSPIVNTNMLLARSFKDEDSDSNNINLGNFADRLKSNLKWWTTPDQQIFSEHFISQFVMMCMWQALENDAKCIYWRWSYPGSFHSPQDYFDMLDRAIIKAKQEVGFAFDDGKLVDFKEMEYTTESHAAGLYFNIRNDSIRSRLVNVDSGYITIDIGGGSTDISIWQMNKASKGESPLSSSSIGFAGNSILGDHIKEMTVESQEDLKRDITMSKVMRDASFVTRDHWPEKEKKEQTALAFLNMTLTNIADRDQMRRLLSLNKARDPIKTLLKIVRFNLSALFAYAGNMLKELIDMKRFDVPASGIDIVLCGNGSKTMWWEADTRFEAHLKAVFLKNAGITVPIELIESDQRKGEVAYGLVSKTSLSSSVHGGMSDDAFPLTKDPFKKHEIVDILSKLVNEMRSELMGIGKWTENINDITENIKARVTDNTTFDNAFVDCLKTLNGYFHRK